MLKKILLFSVAVLTIHGSLVAQEKALERANQKYDEYSFRPAIDIYKKVYEKGFESPDLLKRLGNSYYYNADYQDAASIYKLLIEKYDTIVSPDYFFRYAQSLKTLGEYDSSKEVMKRFAALTEDSRIKQAQDIDYLSKIEENSGRYDIKQFKYNSRYSDFAPAFYKKGLIFSSDRDTGNFARYRHTWNAKDFLDLFEVNEDSLVDEPVTKIEGDINTRLHESTSIVTKDGSTMYFTRNNFLDGKKYKDENGTIRLKIYQATLIADGVWGDIIELPFNSDSYSVAHPALSPDEKVLYFVSDMPGTIGESDIFKVQIVGDGTFGAPVNLGKTINTEARETFPFITNSDVLYFASDGHPGLGGLDVFATKIAFDEYDQPIVNVGKPINTKFDDFSLIINEESSEGYFSSNRVEGMGEDDIYSFLETSPIQLDCMQDVTGTVRDRISNEILIGATVKIIDEENNEVSSTITNSKGEYSLNLDCNKGNFVRALMEGYVPSEEYLPKSYGKPQIVDFYLERDVVSGGFGDDLAKLLQLSTIYFDLNKYDIRPDAEIEIQKVIVAMEKYPSLKIKINAHTDSRGNDAYNLWLSQKRAEATVNYMIAKGIGKNRLEGEGFGEEKLLNECGNGVPCSREKHQLNRRSEFIILE
ncbi:OmpA family protein [uncultured Croceitalea sp.]|uniref:OmpA family protein n=1 Tax=uncultured Croceitalea sp. TaxID=1798908 RepID=UPI0033067BDC